MRVTPERSENGSPIARFSFANPIGSRFRLEFRVIVQVQGTLLIRLCELDSLPITIDNPNEQPVRSDVF